jgi:hypothetical protein
MITKPTFVYVTPKTRLPFLLNGTDQSYSGPDFTRRPVKVRHTFLCLVIQLRVLNTSRSDSTRNRLAILCYSF